MPWPAVTLVEALMLSFANDFGSVVPIMGFSFRPVEAVGAHEAEQVVLNQSQKLQLQPTARGVLDTKDMRE